MQPTIDFLTPVAALTPAANFRIALVGIEFEENLSLRYLAGALMADGYAQVAVYAYNSITQAEELAERLVAGEVDLVGVSMAFQVRAVEDMVLVQLLREFGFRGHITAGGQFATLHYEEIFHDCTGLDSIVRFEAEATAVQLAEALRAPEPALLTVPGLVWRAPGQTLRINHSTPAPGDINDLALPLRKADRTEYLGLKTMHMVGSRGCHATCKYCCVAALATERNQAAKASGGATALPGTRRRTAHGVAHEITRLYEGHGVRIFEFQDDNWIHPKVETAVAYFHELKAELDRLGVGQIGLSLKTRADSVQPEILQALQAIGLIRVFVGIESGTQSLLTNLGRKSRDNSSLRALQTLREFGVPAYFNALLFGPDVRFAEIEPELEFLELGLDFPFEVVEVVIYGKTGLYLSLTAEQRLHGNYLAYEYDYLDEATQRTYALVSQLDTRHFGVYSPVKMAADLGFNLGILQVFYPGPETRQLAQRVAALTRRINVDQLALIRRAAAWAQQPGSLGPARRELRAAAVAADLDFYRQIIALHHEMEQLVARRTHSPAVRCYYRTGAVVQSALLAGLFALVAGTAQGQATPPAGIDSVLTRQGAGLYRNFNRRDWKLFAQKLEPKTEPIATHLIWPTTQASDYTDKGKLKPNVRRSMRRFNDHIADLARQRQQEDYKQLRAILLSHNPKIKIASTLMYSADANGQVQEVAVTSTANAPKLSGRTRKVILQLLKDRQFRTREARGWFTEPHPFRERVQHLRRRAKTKLRKTLIKLHLKKVPVRRGPLD